MRSIGPRFFGSLFSSSAIVQTSCGLPISYK
jgi:hypothetical protein